MLTNPDITQLTHQAGKRHGQRWRRRQDRTGRLVALLLCLAGLLALLSANPGGTTARVGGNTQSEAPIHSHRNSHWMYGDVQIIRF